MFAAAAPSANSQICPPTHHHHHHHHLRRHHNPSRWSEPIRHTSYDVFSNASIPPAAEPPRASAHAWFFHLLLASIASNFTISSSLAGARRLEQLSHLGKRSHSLAPMPPPPTLPPPLKTILAKAFPFSLSLPLPLPLPLYPAANLNRN